MKKHTKKTIKYKKFVKTLVLFKKMYYNRLELGKQAKKKQNKKENIKMILKSEVMELLKKSNQAINLEANVLNVVVNYVIESVKILRAEEQKTIQDCEDIINNNLMIQTIEEFKQEYLDIEEAFNYYILDSIVYKGYIIYLV